AAMACAASMPSSSSLGSMPLSPPAMAAVGARELVRLVEVLLPSLEGLLGQHRTPVALHSRMVGRDGLCGEHAFELVPGLDAPEPAGHGCELLCLPFRGRVLRPKGVCDPTQENVVEV